MGRFLYHQWGRFLGLTSATYMLWASLWAFFYRKFFWDIVPGANARPFVVIIVDIPFLQICTALLALVALALELPAPFLSGTAIHRSLVLRVVLYFLTGFVGILVYQTVDCAVYFVITSMVYAKAMTNGETIESHVVKDDIEA